MECIHLTKDRDKRWAGVNTVMNCRVPQNAENFLTSRGRVSLSKRSLPYGNYLSSCLLNFQIQGMNIQ
jgi:hypothetical protein